MPARMAHIIVITLLIVLATAILANSMAKPVGRDEQMYCTGAVCLAQGKMIYRDFSYAAQMPYHPLLCGALYKMLGTTHYLLVGRLLSCACDILVIVCIVGIYRHIFKPFTVTGLLLGLAAVALYVFNPLVDYANGYAWNHDVVILCVVLSMWLFISADFQKKSQHWRIAAIGALLTFATFMRITTVIVELLFFLAILSLPAKSIQQRLKTALPFLAASALVMIWPVWIIAQAPQAFFLNLIKIPTIYGQWLHEIGMVHNKFALTFTCLTTPGYFVLIVLTICLWPVGLMLRRRLKITKTRGLWLAALLPVVFFMIALIPPTMWRQYLAIPVPFMVIGLAFPLSYLRRASAKSKVSIHFVIASIMMSICTLVAVFGYLYVIQRIPLALVPEKWAPVEMHKVSEEIIAKAKEPKQILTLAPLLALEGGGEIYTELAAGDIIYRIADYLSPRERQITHTAGSKNLLALTERTAPSAVILSRVEMQRFHALILEVIVQPDWKKEEYENGPTVYFKP